MHGANWWSFVRFDEEQDSPRVSWALIRRAARYGRPYLPRLAGMLAILVTTTILQLVPPLLVRDLIDRTLPQRDFNRLTVLALAMIGVPLLSGLLGVVQRFLSASVGEGVILDLRVALYAHLQRMSLRFFTQTRTGELMSRLNNDVGGAQRAVTGTLVDLASNVVALAGTLTIMLRLDWRLTLLAVVVLPLFIIPSRLLGLRLRAVVRQQMVLNSEMNAMMNETLNVSGALLVKLFGRAAAEVSRFSERARRVAGIGVRQALMMRWFLLTLGLVSSIGTALVFWAGGLLVLRETGFTIGTIVAFTAYLGMLYGPIASLTNARVDLATSLVSFERVFEVLDLPEEVQQSASARTLEQVSGEVAFEGVSFSYAPVEGIAEAPVASLSAPVRFGRSGGAEPPPLSQEGGRMAGAGSGDRTAPDVEAARWALEDVSFTVRAGQLAALVGPSGAGKTTVSYLLPRLYDPQRGRITLDGVNLRDLTLDTLSSQIGMVTQETYLFNDTMLANLLYARPGASAREIEEACRAANIHEFIEELPDRYNTVVGNRGYRLSGGEKQRLAIARVILKDPRILVLDEATSSLDSQSEALIQEALERIMVGRTSLVIAHRLSTILAADVILVLHRGRLVEQGTHPKLLASGGLYAKLYETQFRHAGTGVPSANRLV